MMLLGHYYFEPPSIYSRRARLQSGTRSIDAFGRPAEDMGVVYGNGIPLARVPRDPKPGQYSVLDGIYVFSGEEDRRRTFVICVSVEMPTRAAAFRAPVKRKTK